MQQTFGQDTLALTIKAVMVKARMIKARMIKARMIKAWIVKTILTDIENFRYYFSTKLGNALNILKRIVHEKVNKP
jgi:hypothetical protein